MAAAKNVKESTFYWEGTDKKGKKIKHFADNFTGINNTA